MDGMSWRQLATVARLLLLLCVLPGARPSLCKSVFSPIAGDMPKDFSLKVGDPLVLKCTLETPKFNIGNKTYTVNGSHLEIKFNDTQVPSELLTVGDTWVTLRKERSEYSDTGNYNCNIRVGTPRVDTRVFHVCATQVTIGDPPLPVENFRCINYFFMNMTCYWEPIPNSVKTDYRLGEKFAFTKVHPGFYRLCPLPSHAGNGSACSWTLSSSPPLRKETPVFRFVLNGTNALGTRNFTYIVEHLKIVKISDPTDFKCSAVSKRSITLSWNASAEQKENPKLLVIYEVHYRSQYEPTWETVRVFNKTSHMVQGLNPHTTYAFRLRGRASQADLEELWTNYIELLQTTLKDVPEAPPRISRSGFKVQNYKDSRTIMLNFAALPERKWGGATLQYLIRCCEEDVAEENCDNKTVDMPTATFDGLFLNSRYNFQLWSLNEIGLSRVHSSLRVDKYDELLNKPQDIRVLALGSGTYEVSWRPPSIAQLSGSSTSASAEEEYGGVEKEPSALTSYTVFWCPRMLPRSYSCNESLEWQKPELNASSLTLNLDPGNVYQFAVAAQTADKASEMDWTTCVIPFSKELEKITQVWFRKNTDNELALRWQLECSALKSYIQSYQIEVCMVLPMYQKIALHDAAGCMSSRYDPKTCKVYNATDRDAEEVELLGLKTNMVYRAVVRASSEGKLTEDSPAQCAIKQSELAIGLVIGFAVGGAVGCTALVFVLYLLARWMKKKVDMIKEIKIQLPDGLDSSEANQMHSYKNNKNGAVVGKAGETNRSPHIAYGRMGCFSAAASAGPKKRHDSGHSQGSSSSTDELLYKKTRRADTFGRNPSGDSSGGSTNGQDSVVSAGTARTGVNSSCDSGAESDPAAPPSPDCLVIIGNHTPLARCRPNLPKLDEDRVRESQDSGLDAEVTPPIMIPSSDALSEPTYSKLGATSPDSRSPLLQSQAVATSEPSLFEGPENGPERVEPIPPYSKFGLARSTEEISVAPYTMACRSSPEIRRLREGPPALPYSQLALRQQPSASGMGPPPAFAGTDVTVGLALEQPRFLPHMKSSPPVPFFPKPPPSGYVTVGQAMKPQLAAEPQSGQGYSKFSIQPPKPVTRPQGSSGYVPLQDVIGVHQVSLPPAAPVVEEDEPSPGDHLRDTDSSSDDVAIVGDDNSNNASLEDFSFSSASGRSLGEPTDVRFSPQRTTAGQQPSPGYVAATVMPAKPPALDLSDEPRMTSNGYVPLPSTSPGDTHGVVGDYVTHTAAFDWGRSVPGDSEVDMDESGALTPPVSAAKTNGYVMLPTTMDAVGTRTQATVGFVPGVKPGSSSSQVDCSV